MLSPAEETAIKIFKRTSTSRPFDENVFIAAETIRSHVSDVLKKAAALCPPDQRESVLKLGE